jgi:hypothetical protein
MQAEWFSLSDNRKAAIVAAAQKVRSCNQAHKGFPFVLGHYREHIYGIVLLEQDADGVFAGYDVRTKYPSELVMRLSAQGIATAASEEAAANEYAEPAPIDPIGDAHEKLEALRVQLREEVIAAQQRINASLHELACQMDLGWRYRRDLALPASHGMNM